ncbi:MAG: hypothetical protein PHY80_00575 [Rickettsiales bacterium]|nr:hypothetical protein [Rickettsiales bacterium]
MYRENGQYNLAEFLRPKPKSSVKLPPIKLQAKPSSVRSVQKENVKTTSSSSVPRLPNI